MSQVIVSLVALIVAIGALIASLPLLSRYAVYHLYRPKLTIFFAPETGQEEMAWSHMVERTVLDGSKLNPWINIRSRTKRPLTAEIEFTLDKPWQTDSGSLLVETGLGGGFPLKGGFWFRTRTIHIPAFSTAGIAFPFEPRPEECVVEIALHPKVRLSEFRLPIYFGEVSLKSIKRVFKITSNAE